MSGPPNVGSGELSRIARKKSPNAPKWRNIEAKLRPRTGLAVWRRTFNMGNISTLPDWARNRHCSSPELGVLGILLGPLVVSLVDGRRFKSSRPARSALETLFLPVPPEVRLREPQRVLPCGARRSPVTLEKRQAYQRLRKPPAPAPPRSVFGRASLMFSA